MLDRVRRFSSLCPRTDQLRRDTPTPPMIALRLIIQRKVGRIPA